MRSNRFAQAVLAVSCLSLAAGSVAQETRMLEADSSVSVNQVAGPESQQPSTPAAGQATGSTPSATSRPAAAEDSVLEVIRRAPGERYFVPEMRVDDIFVTNPQAISATVRDMGIEVTFVGRGTSDLQVIRGNDRRVYRFVTVEQDVDRSLEELRRMLSGIIGVNVERVGDSIIASGQVLTQEDAKRYETVIQRYDVVDLVERRYFQVEQERLLADLMDAFRAREFDGVKADLRKNNKGEPFVILTGFAYTDRQRDFAADLASSYFDNVTNQISLDKPEVQLDIILVTFDLEKVTSRGREQGPFSDIVLNLGTEADRTAGITLDADLGNGDYDFSNGFLFGQVLAGGALLRLLKTEESVTNYTEAFTVVKSGESATYQDGGSILVPLVGSEAVGIATIDTGLVLTMLPIVDDNKKITVNVSVDNNSTTESGTEFTGGGENTPGTLALRTSRSESTITAENNQTVVVSGINSNLYGRSTAETPLLGKIPIVNLFFKKQGRRGSNTRSYFFITPRVPTLFNEGRPSIAEAGQEAREFFERHSEYVIPGPGFYLGWDDDNKTVQEVPPAPWDQE
jgi:Flp pilus assembly secretin CpaC